MTRRAAYKGYRNNDQSAETSMDTKTHTGGTSQLEIRSRLFFKKYGGLYFLLSCNYDAEDFENASSFYRDILLFFHELKALYGSHHGQDTILFHNKEIRIDGKPFFWKERFEKGITTIKDLLDKNGNVLSFPVFQLKYSQQKTTFLHFYQVICAIPGRLLTKAKTNDFSAEMINNEDPESFHLDKIVVINLLRAKSTYFYW